jgi:hypothetical protein
MYFDVHIIFIFIVLTSRHLLNKNNYQFLEVFILKFHTHIMYENIFAELKSRILLYVLSDKFN